ncbi:MAG TPA: hypothetical protein VJN18_11080 [Polyangiaceae bacterium]|nr:hypothetical protein [Polyangiaceae bacterium]
MTWRSRSVAAVLLAAVFLRRFVLRLRLTVCPALAFLRFALRRVLRFAGFFRLDFFFFFFAAMREMMGQVGAAPQQKTMDEWTAGGGVAALALTALLAYLRRRRGKTPAGRVRARFMFSFRSPPSAGSEPTTSEPPPFPERDTHRRRAPKKDH